MIPSYPIQIPTARPRCESCCSSDSEDRKDTEAQVLSLAAEVCQRYRLIAEPGAMRNILKGAELGDLDGWEI